MPNRCLALALLLIAVAIGGCAPTSVEVQAQQAIGAYYSADYTRAIELLRPLAKKTDQDFVLNNLRLGSAALAAYDFDQAEAAFLQAYEVLNSFGVNNGGRTAGAFLVDEKVKIWKGEPFERAMANFYLGVVYYQRHDYNNARAAFENALFKLRDYGENAESTDKYAQQETNFTLGYLMLAKCWQRLGRPDLAKANFDRVTQLRPNLAPITDYAMNEESNCLLIVDYGYGPHKATNFDGAIVGFVPTPREEGPIPGPTVSVDGSVVQLQQLSDPLTDLLVIAQDRKWQSIDTVRAVKSAIGTGLLAAGAYTGLNADKPKEGWLALGLVGAGLLMKATSQSDIRVWDTLPRTVFILPMHLQPGRHDIEVVCANGVKQSWRGMTVSEKGESTYYMRLGRYNPGPYDWPPPTYRDQGANP